MDRSAIEELTAVARESGAREARVEELLRDIWGALDPAKHEELKSLLLQILKVVEANYTQSYNTYTLICSMLGVEVTEANKLQRQLGQRALERDVDHIKANVAIRADKVDVGRDLVGRDKITDDKDE
jgi:hypothetical protein